MAVVLVGGWLHRWVAEDAYIDFRVIHNIWNGYGPVFNPGERVEVYTDPLWVFVLTVLGRVFSFVNLAWWAVLLGLFSTASGFVLAARAAQHLTAWRRWRPALPVGLAVAASLDAVWDFSTSGLETGLIFGWEGLSWWLLIRCATVRRGVTLTAFVLGLGPLIRPDLALFTVSYVVALVYVVARTPVDQERGRLYRWVFPAGALLAVPVAYQVWRMAYFALLLPNTAIAKSSGAAWWSQGYTYFRDFYSSDHLYLVALLLVGIVVYRFILAARSADWMLVVLLGAPLGGAVLDCAYVVRVGGDFMHARMLLPSFFAFAMVAWVNLPRARTIRILAVGTLSAFVLIWSISARYNNRGHIATTGITNERLYWMHASGSHHPVTLRNYGKEGGVIVGKLVASLVAEIPQGHGYIVMTGSNSWITISTAFPLRGPERAVAAGANVGLFGTAAGDRVYVYDGYSIANPITSHMTLAHRGRPGHEKVGSIEWMTARFVPPGISTPRSLGPLTEVSKARLAVTCEPLKGYLHGITGPLTLHQVLSNLLHAARYTSMAFSGQPVLTAQQLCF